MPIQPLAGLEDTDEYQKAALERKLKKFYGASDDGEPNALEKLASITSTPVKSFIGNMASGGSIKSAYQSAKENFGEPARIFPQVPSYQETAGKLGIKDEPLMGKEEYETLEAQDPMAARDARFFAQASKQKLAANIADVALDPVQYFPQAKVAGLAGKFSMIAPGIIKEIGTGKILSWKEFKELIDAGKMEGLLWHGTNTRTMRGAKEAEELLPAADPRRAVREVVQAPDPEYTLLSKEPGHVKGSLEHYYANPASQYRTGVSQADMEKEGALFAIDPAKKGHYISAIDQSGNAKPISYNLEGELPTPSTGRVGDIYSSEPLTPKYRITDEDIAKVLKKMKQDAEIPGVKNIERVTPDLVAEAPTFNKDRMSGSIVLKDMAMGGRRAGGFKFGPAEKEGTIYSNEMTEIDPIYHSLGGTKKMYKKAEEVSGAKMVKSPTQFPGGKKVWKNELGTPPENITPEGEISQVGIGKRKIAENLADAERQVSERGGSYRSLPDPEPIRLTPTQESHLEELRSAGMGEQAEHLTNLANRHSTDRDVVRGIFKAQNKNLGPYVEVPGSVTNTVPNFKSQSGVASLGDGPPLTPEHDPFTYMDNKYGVTKRILSESRSPMQIHTMSDLIGRTDYMNLIPKNSTVTIYRAPSSFSPEAERAILPGFPSSGRTSAAAEKLRDNGINVNVKELTYEQMKEMASRHGSGAIEALREAASTRTPEEKQALINFLKDLEDR